MRNYLLFASLLILLAACKLQPDSDRQYTARDESKMYRLQLKPDSGAVYHYTIENESEINMDVQGNEIINLSQTDAGVNYEIGKDSSGNLVLNVQYDKVKIYTKNGENETRADAANALVSIDPVEKMLGLLLSIPFKATVSDKGGIINIDGYTALSEKLMEGMDPNDLHARQIAKTQLDKVIGEGMIKKNMDQLFKVFPDSLVHIGDSWKTASKEEGEINMTVKNTFKLNGIDNGLANIESKGTIVSNDKPLSLMGYNGIVAKLTGEQRGDFDIEAETGMLINCTIKSSMKGTIQVLGKEIPMLIESSIIMKGRRK